MNNPSSKPLTKLEELKAKMAAMKSASTVQASPPKLAEVIAAAPAIQSKPIYAPKMQLAPDAPGFELQAKVVSLSEALLDRHPRMPGLLDEIFKTIKQYPEQVTILEEEGIAQVVEGLKLLTGVKFAEVVNKGGASKKLKNATVDMF